MSNPANPHVALSPPGGRPHPSRANPTPSPLPFLSELEGLRALAAIAVMLTHAGFLSGATGRSILPGFLARLDIGVAVFFVLSGFLLFRPYSRAILHGEATPAVSRFAAHRAARLLPAWLACLAGTVLLVPEVRDASQAAWVANLLHVQAWNSDWDLPGLAQLWSLSTEVAFYILLPVIAWFVSQVVSAGQPRRLLCAVLALVGVAWVTRIAYHQGLLADGVYWARTLPLTLDWFALGMVLSVMTTRGPRFGVLRAVLRKSGTAALVLAGAVFWFLTTWAAGPYGLTAPLPWQDWVKHLGYGTVAFLVVLPSAVGATTPLTPLLRSRVVTFLGRVSYAFFLWHLPVLFWVRTTLGLEWFAGGFWITAICTFTLTLGVASLSWVAVERPILKRVKSRSGNQATSFTPHRKEDH